MFHTFSPPYVLFLMSFVYINLLWLFLYLLLFLDHAPTLSRINPTDFETTQIWLQEA